MSILVACEESQSVTIELRKLGYEAYSCDIEECSGGHNEWHIMQDVLPLLDGYCEFKTVDGISHKIDSKWDMIVKIALNLGNAERKKNGIMVKKVAKIMLSIG